MGKHNLTSRLKKSLLTGLLAGYLGLTGCGRDGSVPQPPKQPSLSQTVSLVNDIDIDYRATLQNINTATRNTFYTQPSSTQEQLIDTRTINAPGYSEIFRDKRQNYNLKGGYCFVLEIPGKTDVACVNVPDYPSEAPDLSGLNLDLNEEDSLIVKDLPRAKDKNPEDNPVHYTSVNSSNVNASIGIFPDDTTLTIKAPQIPGPDPVPYIIKLSREGSLEEITLEGKVLNRVRPYLVKLTETYVTNRGGITQDSDKNLVMGMEQGIWEHGSIFSYDLQGNLRWSIPLKTAGTVLDIVSNNEGIYFTGNPPESPDASVGKVSNQGEILFLNKLVPPSGLSLGNQIALRNDIVYAGVLDWGDNNIYIYKFDSNGIPLNYFSLGEGITILGLKIGPDYILASGPSDYGAYLRKTNLEGTLLWEKRFPETGRATIEEDLDGSIYMGGDNVILKLDSDGNELWKHDWINAGENGYIMDLIKNPKGGIVAVGAIGGLSEPNDVGAVALDANGNLMWDFRLDQDKFEYFQSGVFTDENTLYLPMLTQHDIHREMWLTKLVTP